MQLIQSRRRFLAAASMAGAASILGVKRSLAVENDPPPETTTIRLPGIPSACVAPLFVAEKLMHEEGFTDVQYVPTPLISVGMVADGDIDFSMEPALDYLPLMDVDRPLVVLSGVHVGCLELRANDSIQRILDLRNKRVGVGNLSDSVDHALVSIMAAYVGLDPATEIEWVVDPEINQVDLFTAGKIDAFVGFPPDPQQSCERTVGHVVVNTASDLPWSNYFCCMATANADFVRNNPVATKRALRALLKATDICHEQPELAATRMVEFGFSQQCALTILTDARYGLWREYDPEDTVRFFTLRLHELGKIKKTPNEVISEHTDWRFLDEIKNELA